MREYEHNGVKVAVVPSALGLATIHDKNILDLLHQLARCQNEHGRGTAKNPAFEGLRLLVATNRNTDGRGYEQLKGALDR